MAAPRVIDFLMSGVVDSNGSPLVGGKVFTYSPGTLTLKSTWQDYDQASAHTNPIILDAQGAKQVYAVGSYDIVIKNSDESETLYTYDGLNYSGNDGTSYYGSVATGSENALEISVPLAANDYTDGQLYTFVAQYDNTSTATIDINGGGQLTIYNNLTGLVLSGGEIVADRLYFGITYDFKFYILNARPTWASWTPTLAGWSANPAIGVYRYSLLGKFCTIAFYQGGAATSTTGATTMTLPFTAATITNMSWTNSLAQAIDNGVSLTTPGLVIVASGGTIATFYKDNSGAAFTTSGTKIIRGQLTYEIA